MTNPGGSAGTVAGDEQLRLFCALQLSASTAGCLAAWQAANLERGRIVPPEHLHVTLAFLGRRPASEVPAIAGQLRAAAAGTGALDLRPAGYRETRSVGMIVLEDVGGAANRLAQDVQARLERLGVYRPERRAWLPHVTVLRFKSPAGLAPAPANTCSIHVVRAALYRSVLGAGGARYEALETGALGGQ